MVNLQCVTLDKLELFPRLPFLEHLVWALRAILLRRWEVRAKPPPLCADKDGTEQVMG